jgi:hypothetical protein
MCRSKAEGGRRCPAGTVRPAAPRPCVGVTGPAPASSGKPPVSRAEAKARWALAERTLADAKAAVGPLVGNRSSLLLGPLSQQARIARGGGDPSVYDEQVAEGRDMLSSMLVSHGDSPGAAAAKIKALATAYAAWSATPEAR